MSLILHNWRLISNLQKSIKTWRASQQRWEIPHRLVWGGPTPWWVQHYKSWPRPQRRRRSNSCPGWSGSAWADPRHLPGQGVTWPWIQSGRIQNDLKSVTMKKLNKFWMTFVTILSSFKTTIFFVSQLRTFVTQCVVDAQLLEFLNESLNDSCFGVHS